MLVEELGAAEVPYAENKELYILDEVRIQLKLIDYYV